MRKPDDELKINISELFGGDLPSPSESLEDISGPEPSTVSQTSPKIPPEVENQFLEWMNQRNQQLEAKNQDLERNLQETSASSIEPAPQTFDTAPTEMDKNPIKKIAPELIVPKSPIDFDAPIAPPFMGPVNSQLQTLSSGNPSSQSEMRSSETPQAVDEMKKLQAEHEFLMLYDEFRSIIAYELKDLVGEKKTLTMLERTVELVRGKFPQIFRNVNWDSAGNLLRDGSMDNQRIIENKKTIDPQKADEVVDAALSTLLSLRLQAVEKGLGSGLKNKVRARMYQWISEKSQKAIKEGRDHAALKRLSGYVAAT